MTTHLPREPLELNQTLARLDRRFYQLIRPPQRHYYRSGANHSSQFWLSRGPNVVAGSVVGLCVAVYGANVCAKDYARRTHDFKPMQFMRKNFVSSLENVEAGRWWVMATSSLMHEGYLHLGLNMYAVWSLGPAIMSYFGAPQFLGLWLFSAVSCSAASLYWAYYKEELRRDKKFGRRLDSQSRPQWTRHINLGDGNVADYYGGAVGSSGSIFGFLAAIMCMTPKSSVSIIGIPMLSFPIWLNNVVFAVGSVYCMVTGAIPYISHAGHLGGMAGGVVYYLSIIRLFLRIRGRRF